MLTHIIPVMSRIMNALSTCFHVCEDHRRVGIQRTTGATHEHDEMRFGVSLFATVIKSCYNVIMITKWFHDEPSAAMTETQNRTQ